MKLTEFNYPVRVINSTIRGFGLEYEHTTGVMAREYVWLHGDIVDYYFSLYVVYRRAGGVTLVQPTCRLQYAPIGRTDGQIRQYLRFLVVNHKFNQRKDV